MTDRLAAEVGRLVCPIGDFGVPGKRPAVIAALVAAEMVRILARHTGARRIQEQPGKEAVG